MKKKTLISLKYWKAISMDRAKAPFYWMFYQRIMIGLLFILLPVVENLIFGDQEKMTLEMYCISAILIFTGTTIVFFPLRILWENRFSALEAGRCLWISSYKRHHKESLVIDPDTYYKNMKPIRWTRVFSCLFVIVISMFLVFGPLRLPVMFFSLFIYFVPILAFILIRREIVGWP